LPAFPPLAFLVNFRLFAANFLLPSFTIFLASGTSLSCYPPPRHGSWYVSVPRNPFFFFCVPPPLAGKGAHSFTPVFQPPPPTNTAQTPKNKKKKPLHTPQQKKQPYPQPHQHTHNTIKQHLTTPTPKNKNIHKKPLATKKKNPKVNIRPQTKRKPKNITHLNPHPSKLNTNKKKQ